MQFKFAGKKRMGVRNYSIWLCGIIIVMMAIRMTPAYAEMGTPLQPPPYLLNRADEDYRYLTDLARRADLWDPLKFVPFNEAGSWYLSFGGEARVRYKYFNLSGPNSPKLGLITKF
jgi:hypothetical protein